MPSNLRRILGVLLAIVQASDAVEVRLPLYASLIDLLSLCLPGDPLTYDAPSFQTAMELVPGLTSRPEGFVDFHIAQHARKGTAPVKPCQNVFRCLAKSHIVQRWSLRICYCVDSEDQQV